MPLTLEPPSDAYIEAVRHQGLRPGVVVCLMNGARLLLFYKKEYNLWQIPQGGIRASETLDQALVREMTEELGKEIVSKIQLPSAFVGENQVVFPPEKLSKEMIETEEGEKIPMQGKKYFFVAAELGTPDISIQDTDFDDYRWTNFLDALNLADTIYQKGKKRITIDAIHSLRRTRWL